MNIFAQNFAHLFGTQLSTNALLCAVGICQINGNTNFKKFHNWTKSWFLLL